VVKFRKIDPRKRIEDEMQLDLYLQAMGEI
jgi:uncharacterized protein (UPF0335 family)